MTMGFRSEDEDEDEEPSGILEGKHSGEDSTDHDVDLFYGLCKDLRELGACDVKMGSMRAKWPVDAQPPRPAVLRVPVGSVSETGPTEPPPAPKRTTPTDEELRLYPDEHITPELRAQRVEQLRVKQLLQGGG